MSMKMYVYGVREFDEKAVFERFCEKYDVSWEYTNEMPDMGNLDNAKGYEIVNVITSPVGKPIIDRWHEIGVKCIATRTAGYDHIDYEYAKSLGMGVINITYSPSSVADFTIMMMLMGCRKFKHIMQTASVQDFTLKGKIGMELPNCTVGIIGTGKIGRTVIEHLKGFGCKILAYDIYESDEARETAEYVSLDKILTECDIISLHVPLTSENYHMIDSAAIEKMKKGVMIINCARGALIDTQALIDGVESGKIGFAGLDVIEHEFDMYYFNRVGEPLGNPQLAILNSHSNVLVAPHMAFYTDKAVEDMVENSILRAMEYMAC